MAARKAISKKTRFEVFKRDSFKCQYCGRSAPEVILHVDHIKPVKEDGENDLMNYITSCQDCNLGKGARRLSDSSEIEKQKRELDLLQERREQLEMMIQWRDSLHSVLNDEIDVIDKMFSDMHGSTFTDYGKKALSRLIRLFSFSEVMKAVECSESYEQSKGDITKYLSAICRKNREDKEKPYMSDLYYIRGILGNRYSNYE
jgi:hypothetical protein